ncbi:acyl dehydratase [Rhodoligotrophos appendicifer]|uniref:MaoC family dehydratase n=1 Tax=Rhodoligotrophos appendicifer TaxID=987056 RepID=UPI001184EA73|nr:MaoC family dehydratase [Rhodoligotrophos appendicifer]
MSGSREFDPQWVPPFRVGESFKRQLTFDADSIRAFAVMAHDVNPLHTDEEVANRSRFGGLIASGTHSMSWLMGELAEFITGRSASVGLQFNITLRRAVRAGEVMSAEWTVDKLYPKESLGGHLMELTGQLINSDGEPAVIIKGTSLVMPGNPE